LLVRFQRNREDPSIISKNYNFRNIRCLLKILSLGEFVSSEERRVNIRNLKRCIFLGKRRFKKWTKRTCAKYFESN
jgi:hypothetical protein